MLRIIIHPAWRSRVRPMSALHAGSNRPWNWSISGSSITSLSEMESALPWPAAECCESHLITQMRAGIKSRSLPTVHGQLLVKSGTYNSCRRSARSPGSVRKAATTYPTPTTKLVGAFCRTCSSNDSGSNPRSAIFGYAFPAKACASSISMASTKCSPTFVPRASASRAGRII